MSRKKSKVALLFAQCSQGMAQMGLRSPDDVVGADGGRGKEVTQLRRVSAALDHLRRLGKSLGLGRRSRSYTDERDIQLSQGSLLTLLLRFSLRLALLQLLPVAEHLRKITACLIHMHLACVAHWHVALVSDVVPILPRGQASINCTRAASGAGAVAVQRAP